MNALIGSHFKVAHRAYDYEELITRDKASLDIFWLRRRPRKSDNLTDPDVLS
jgi:type I restriction enzyme M protein